MALVSARQLERVAGYVRTGLEEGTLVTGGARHGDAGWYHTPTILTGVPESARVVQEEIVEGAGHLFLWDDMDVTAPLIEQFVNGDATDGLGSDEALPLASPPATWRNGQLRPSRPA